jgi:hypothetical protein
MITWRCTTTVYALFHLLLMPRMFSDDEIAPLESRKTTVLVSCMNTFMMIGFFTC